MSHTVHHLGHLQATGDVPFSRPDTPHKDLVVGFCGLGAMGFFMARNLANRLATTSHSPLHVWNRTRSKSERLAQEVGESKIKVADKPEDLALECDIIITNLANDEVVKDTFEKFARALKASIQRYAATGSGLITVALAGYAKHQVQDLRGVEHRVSDISG